MAERINQYSLTAQEALEKDIADLEKGEFALDEEFEKKAQEIQNNASFAERITLINELVAREYKRRVERLRKERQKTYREQVINFNDDILTDRERLLLSSRKEDQTMQEWKKDVAEQRAAKETAMAKPSVLAVEAEEKER